MPNITVDIIRHASGTPDAPALLLPDREISYAALNKLVWNCAQHLHDKGVRVGQVVGLTFADEFALVLTMLAVTRLGATIYSIPRSATPMQRKDMASRAKLLVLATDQPDRFDAGVSILQLDWQAVMKGSAAIDSTILSETPSAPWLLITGSGSTGQPKLIPITHAQARARAAQATSLLDMTQADRVAPLSHFDFSHSKFRLHEAFWVGASCALHIWDATNPILQCARQSLSVVYSTVFHAERLLESLPRGFADSLHGIRVFEITSSTVSDDLRQRIRRSLCANLYVRYAINEAGPVAMARPNDVYDRPGSVGKPPSGVEIQIVDRSLQPVPPETVGLIRIKSPGLMSRYRDNEEADHHSFHDGWFLPGDLGKLDRDSHLIFYGRADHMMIMNGMNIYPAEIEQVFAAHPDVRDAAAVPFKHKVHQDVPICAVVPQAGAHLEEKAMLAYSRERLGAHGPHRVVILDRIPRNHEGKLIRNELGSILAARLDKHASSPVVSVGETPRARPLRGKGQSIRSR